MKTKANRKAQSEEALAEKLASVIAKIKELEVLKSELTEALLQAGTLQAKTSYGVLVRRERIVPQVELTPRELEKIEKAFPGLIKKEFNTRAYELTKNSLPKMLVNTVEGKMIKKVIQYFQVVKEKE